MDKAQKQLYKTYYRKRKLAAKENQRLYGFKNYEVDFGLDNKLIDINNLNEEQRTEYYNKQWGTDYIYIGKFGEYGGEIAFVKNKNNRYFFVNKQGKLDITGINLDKVKNDESRRAYYNQLWGTDYVHIVKFGEYNNDVTYVVDNNLNGYFLNRQGKPDIIGVNPDEINDYYTRAAYYNILWGTNYENIYEFGEFGGNVAEVLDKNGNHFFLNKQGKPNITGINPNKLINFYHNVYDYTKALIAKQNG